MKKRSTLLSSIVLAFVMALMCVMAACTPAAEPITLTMKQETAEVFVGSTVKLSVEQSRDLLDTEKLEWTTDQASVATVNNGTVRGVSAGTAKITVSVGDASASCTVTVKEKRTITGLQETATIDLDKGETTVQLSATCSDGGAIEWKSKDTAVATVDQKGLVTAVDTNERVRTVEITATRGEATATCVVTVKKDSAPLSYDIERGSSNASVAGMPDQWFYFFKTSDGATSTIVSAKYSSDANDTKIELVYHSASETNSSGNPAENYLRYQTSYEDGTAYTVSFTINSNTAGRVKIGTQEFDVPANTPTDIVAGAERSATMPLNIQLYIYGGTEEAPVEVTLNKIAFALGAPEIPDDPVVPDPAKGPEYQIDPATASINLDAENINNKNFFNAEVWTEFTRNNTENATAKPEKQDDGSLKFTKDHMSRFDLFMVDADGNGTMKNLADKGDNLKDATAFYGKPFEYNFTVKADGNFNLLLFATNGAQPNPTKGDHRSVGLAFDVEAGTLTIRQSGSGTTDYVQATSSKFTWNKAGENSLKITVTRYDLTHIILRFEINGEKLAMSGKPENGVGMIYGGNYVDLVDTQSNGYGQRFAVVPQGATTLYITKLDIKRYDADPIQEFVFPSISFASADIEAVNDKAYLVISGTYTGETTAEALLELIRFDLQANNFNSWARYLQDSSLYTVTVGANNTYTLKVDLSSLADNGTYIAHCGINGTVDVKLPAAEGAQDGKQVTAGGRTYTLVYKHGLSESENNFGCVGVTIA